MTTAVARPQKSMKLPSELDGGRLQESIRESIRQLRPFREKRLDMVRLAAGSGYGENTTKWDTPFNIFGQYIAVMSRALVSKTPQYMLSTDDFARRAAVQGTEDWMNEEVDKMELGQELERASTDALYTIGIIKVALANPGQAAMSGWDLRAGTPYASAIDFEDYFVDLHAKDWGDIAFEGNDYRVPLEAAKAMFRRKKGEELTPSDDRDYNEDGDERITMLQRGTSPSKFEVEDYVSLREVYLPRHRLIVTFLLDSAGMFDGEGPLDVRPWLGPYCGPYHKLCLGKVSGNLIPKAPSMDLVVPQKALNRFYRKLIEDTDRWKSVLAVPSGTDVSAITSARNGEAVQYDGRVENLKEIVFGGPGEGVLRMAMHLKEIIVFLGGNFPMVAGLEPQSKTLGQDKMLNENSSRTVGDMQQTTTEFASSVGDAFVWYAWNHPQKQMRSTAKAPGMPEFTHPRTVHPARRPGQPPYPPGTLSRSGSMPKVTVDPYSLSHQTPQQREAYLDRTVQMLTPLMQMLQGQGVNFDAGKYLEKKAKYAQQPDLPELFTIQEPIEAKPGGDGGGDAPGMPANTSREYIRRSVGANSQAAQGADLANATASKAGGFNRTLGAAQ